VSSRPPLVSVVVPAWNAQDTIDECVRSLLVQTYPSERREIIVVDNGSSDATRPRLAAFGDAITVLEEATRGAAAARNAGVRLAAGEIVAFTDSDCTVDEHWLAELVWPLDEPAIGIVGGQILARRPAGAAELFGEAIHDHEAAMLVYSPPYAVTMNWASRAEVLSEVGLFDEALRRGQDVDLSYRIFRAGYRLAFCPAAIVYHRNERTLRSLVREGWQHGFHGVRVRSKHTALLDTSRRRRNRRPGLSRPPRRAGDHRTRYRIAFQSGKWIGAALGTLSNSIAVRTASKPQPASEHHLSGRDADQMPPEA
jgi:GT2 family glycosyltransferase